MKDCDGHVWVPNLTEDGRLDFRMNRQMSKVALVVAKCENCDARTWFTKKQWNALEEAA